MRNFTRMRTTKDDGVMDHGFTTPCMVCVLGSRFSRLHSVRTNLLSSFPHCGCTTDFDISRLIRFDQQRSSVARPRSHQGVFTTPWFTLPMTRANSLNEPPVSLATLTHWWVSLADCIASKTTIDLLPQFQMKLPRAAKH